MDTWKLVAGVILMLALLVGTIYFDHEVIAFISKLLG